MRDLSKPVLLRVTGISVVELADTLHRCSWNSFWEQFVGNSSLTVATERVEVTTEKLLLSCSSIKWKLLVWQSSIPVSARGCFGIILDSVDCMLEGVIWRRVISSWLWQSELSWWMLCATLRLGGWGWSPPLPCHVQSQYDNTTPSVFLEV